MILSIFKPCILFTIFVYGSLSVILEATCYFLPFGVLLSALLTLLIFVFRVPAPDKETVELIVGEDLRNEKENGQQLLMKVAAHRGAALDVPENTLIAFKVCAEKDCFFIEFDVSLTKDNVPVVFHDSTLERMADIDKEISGMTWQELQKVDISVKHPFRDRYPNCKVPTLEETIQQLLNSKQKMFIDIKENNLKMVDIILQMYEKYPKLYTNAVVSSFFPNVIYLIRRKNPKIVCSLAWRPFIFSSTSYSAFTEKGLRRAEQWYKYYLLLICDYLHDWLLFNITYYFLGLSLILLHKDVINP
ncbi:glycerophosphodiester phosphodiesterase 1 [Agrilus planipennis]|uniref:Glycerophosphodiester phosphodiesterase 1 n=1 Tax=Agrilus planipennis TaxID=224129 RepID=A0A1W4XD93_AGRPL|nr:glycerophosphodiester phosphodiesterase 1 [Agrilus planipennis]